MVVKLCGLRWIEFFDPHTSVDYTPRWNGNSIVSGIVLSCQSPTSSAETGRMLSGQSTNQTTWAVSDVTIVLVTRN